MAGKVLNISLNATIKPLQKALESVSKMMGDFASSIEKTDKKLSDSIKANVAKMNVELEKVKQSFIKTEEAGDNAGKKALKVLRQQLKEATAEVKRLADEVGTTDPKFIAASKRVEELNQLIEKASKKGAASLRQQLREATAEAQRLAEEVGTTDPKFIAAAKRAAALKDSIGDTALAIDAMNPDEKFKGVANLMGGIMGVAAGIQGAMTVFGVESDDAQKAVAKLQGLMAMSQGLNQLGGLKDAMGAVKTQVIAASQSMGTFKTALVATGIGAAVVLIGLLAANWDRVTDAIAGTSDKTRAYKMAQEEVTKSVGDAQAKFYEAQNAIDLYKKGLISKEQALKVYNETAGEMVGKTNNILEAERNLENNVSVYLKMMEHKTRAQVLYAKAAEQSAKITTGEAAEVGFWQTIGNAVLTGAENLITFGTAGDFAGKQVASSQRNVAEAQSTVNKLTKVANQDMAEALKLEKQLGDVKAKNAKFDAAQKTTAKKGTDTSEAKMFQETMKQVDAYSKQELELKKQTGLTSLQIDAEFEAIRKSNRFLTDSEILQSISKRYEDEKKLREDDLKSQQDAQMQSAKMLQENLAAAENAAARELEVRKKTGLSVQMLDAEFERIRRENSKLSNEEIYAQIEKSFTSYAASQQLAIDSANAFNQSLQSMATQGITMAAEAIGTALAGGAVSMADIFNNLILMVADTASQLGKQFIAMGTAALVVQTQLLTNPPAAILAGATLVALAAGAKQIMKNMGGAKKMEQGGLVYGSSFVNVGEYGNAHSNPEVIAPLSKLKQMLPSGNSSDVRVHGLIQGNNLQIVAAKQGRTFSRITGRNTL